MIARRPRVGGPNLHDVSAYDSFCNPLGCLTRTGNDVKDLVAVDYGHLSEQGSVYLVNKVQAVVFGN